MRTIDRVLGLEIGADDYLCKPYSPREVVARVRAMLRRAEGALAGPRAALGRSTVGGFVLDESGLRAWWRDTALPLTPVEFRLLRTLLQHPGRVFARAGLLDAIYADFRDVSDRAIDSHVKNLRRKLQATLPEHNCITAVYGVGYRLDMPGEGGDPAPG